MEGIFKHHDKNKFEIYAFDYGNFHQDSTHQRVKKYFNHFFYIDKKSDDAVIKIIKDHKIDIVIHRNGYSQNSRNSLFAKKLAPLQISFLGYPGTMGVKFIDYIIADKVVIPKKMKDKGINITINPNDWKNKSEVKLPLKPKIFLISVLSGKIKFGSSGE